MNMHVQLYMYTVNTVIHVHMRISKISCHIRAEAGMPVAFN